MRQKIYSIFSNVNDAKQAFGSIKKASLNQADLTIIFADEQQHQIGKRNDNYEFAGEGEYVIEPPANTIIWPGLQTQILAGIGKVQIGLCGSNQTDNQMGESNLIQQVGEDLRIIEREIKSDKVVAIIETDSELLPKLRLILESNGGEIL
ncbi:MAG TPA: hypothetical protein DDW65_12000 [Firmicutes bacterium]|jgi:hypothetical protein|nr:hypothetical protein [Bacillota bacterium]